MYVVNTHKSRLAILMSKHNIHFQGKIRDLIFPYVLISAVMGKNLGTQERVPNSHGK